MSRKVCVRSNGLYDEDPLTLQEIALKYLCSNLHLLVTPANCAKSAAAAASAVSSATLSAGDHYYHDLSLPNAVCDKLIEAYQRFVGPVTDDIAAIFANRDVTPLKVVNLRNSTITHYGLHAFLSHNLYALSLWYCENIFKQSRDLLAEYGSNLRSLELGINSNLLRNAEPEESESVDFQLTSPHLRRLMLNSVVLPPQLQFKHLHDLSHLDLTSCVLGNFSLSVLAELPNLHTLVLFNVWPIANQLHSICSLQNLRMLDISISITGNGQGVYDLPDQTLEMLVDNLRNLTHLDISGTNLAGNGVATKELTSLNANRREQYTQTDIPGLATRTQRPLQFLGLYQTSHWACKRHDIPAIEIAGDANEEQILTAARYYHDRPILLTRVLNDLYHLFRFENCKKMESALEIVLSAMDRHLKFKHMQISGSATLFYIVKNRDRSKFGILLRNHIVKTLLNGMETHMSDETMLRNGYLSLTQFHLPGDVFFEYERLIKLLLYGVSKTEQDGFVQRVAIYLLNTLACQVDGKQKLILGEFGVVGTMLALIKNRLTRLNFDDVMEVAWSTMWNVTDETAINCKRFLDGQGMQYFLKCLNAFPDRDELLRNMMGLLGNVAEVQSLRPHLMTQEFIEVFARLLDSHSDGIEVSYNAAGVLAHIASDGPEAWKIELPKRCDVLSRMVRAIGTWNIRSERNINYRSFEPILGLVRCYETPECQHWAIWALANLTQVYPEKYCALVEQENGIAILIELIAHPSPYKEIKDLAQTVLQQCNRVHIECAMMEE